MKRGTIVLCQFPFTDQTGAKLRPALVVSRSDRSGDDCMVAFITGSVSPVLQFSDLLIQSSRKDFASTGLRRDSVIRLDKIAIVHTSLVKRALGALPLDLIPAFDARIAFALGIRDSI